MGIFDEMANRYDNDERAGIADKIAQKIREATAGSEGKTAIDYGCGTGLVGLQLAACFRSLLLVDASPQMIDQVQKKLDAAPLANVGALCANFSSSIPPGLSADIVFMAQVLLHIPDTAGILRQLYHLLNPGGQLLIVDFNKDEGIAHDKVHNGFVQAELADAAKQAGFAHAQAETFYHGQRMFMNRDASLFLLKAEKQA